MSRSQSKAEYGRFAHLVVGGLEWLLSQWQELTGGEETDLHSHAPSGGGSDLAAVLAEGNDTGSVEIVSAPAADANATVTRRATATGEAADAAANSVADTAASSGGNATATQTATAADGNASVDAGASTGDGTASADRSASSETWNAHANTAVAAAGGTGARVHSDATGNGTANASTRLNSFLNGTGTASSEIRAFKNGDDATGVGVRVEATNAGGYKMGFGEAAGAPIAIPQVPASPTVQQVVTALVNLGLITQAS